MVLGGYISIIFLLSKWHWFTGNIPRGVFCEQSSQKTRELQREIMRMHDFCASRSVLLLTEWTNVIYRGMRNMGYIKDGQMKLKV